jgi:hypothetical protein
VEEKRQTASPSSFHQYIYFTLRQRGATLAGGKEGNSYVHTYQALGKPVWRIRDVYPGSRILIFTHPGSRIPDLRSWIPDLGSRIPDPKTATKERGEKKFVVITFYVL